MNGVRIYLHFFCNFHLLFTSTDQMHLQKIQNQGNVIIKIDKMGLKNEGLKFQQTPCYRFGDIIVIFEKCINTYMLQGEKNSKH